MKSKIATKKDYQVFESMLYDFGFLQTDEPGVFEHELITGELDFTACSPKGAMLLIFQYGFAKGFSTCQDNIKKALGFSD